VNEVPHDSEIWRDVTGYEGLYEVSSLGRVRNNKNPAKHGFFMKAAVSTEENGYRNVHIKLSKDGEHKIFRLSRLVWETFHGKIPAKLHVDHIDNDPTNNKLDNLQLLSVTENNRKRWKDNPKLKSHGGVARVKVQCVETGTVFNSIREAARTVHQAWDANIKKALKDPNKTCAGFHWAYA